MGSIRIGFGVLGPVQMTVDGAPVTLGTPKRHHAVIIDTGTSFVI
jgi:SARP family transcriptional regulator, regulator of embCAB operon